MYSPWGTPPQSGVVYVPVPQAAPTAGGFDIDGITRQIAGLEALKKLMKEEKKDSGDKPKDKGGDLQVVNMMLLMILVSPITGPIMSWFFHKGLSMMSGG